jgi:predicted small secreted protein|tara:strand:+ start:211 stop:408 length:198 start_codon:yes stop_codon:yes gene_type:complete
MFKMLIVLFAVVGLSSCGTVAGFGDDIKSVAKWSEKKMTEEEKSEELQDEGFSGVETIPVEKEEL